MPYATPPTSPGRLPPLLIDLGCGVLGVSGLALLVAYFTSTTPAAHLLELAAALLLLLCLLLTLRNHQRSNALRRAHRALELAQRVAHVGSWQLYGDTLHGSAESCRIFGLPPGQSISTAQLLAYTHADDRARVSNALRDVQAGKSVDIEHRIAVDGQLRWVHARAAAAGGASDGTGTIGTVQDVTVRREAEEALCRSRQRLRALGAHHEQLVEEERAHIAREIHDELGQYLTTLRMDAAMLEMALVDENPRAGQRLGNMKSLIDEAIQSVRRVASTLRPTALDLGLESGIEWLVEDFRERTRIACTLQVCEQGLPEADDARATLVFRILQEALTNVARHACARSVTITLKQRDGVLELAVHDDGVGFDQRSLRERKTFGLLGMHERAIVFGGSLRIDSAPGRGATVVLSVPLDSVPMSRDEFPETCEGCPLMEAATELAEKQT